jgi:predicted aspartyl protease
MTINGKINNVPVKILVDTGAQFSTIFNDTINKLDMKDMVDTRGSFTCRGFGTTNSVGIVWIVELEINGGMFPVKSTVLDMKMLNFDMMIGMDFLTSYMARFDLASRKLTLNNKYDITF